MVGVSSSLLAGVAGVGLSSLLCSTLVLRLLLCSDLLRNFFLAKLPPTWSADRLVLRGGVSILLGLATSSRDSKL